MRNIARLTIAAVSLGLSAQYALDGRWWVVLICGLVGALWITASAERANPWRRLGLLVFAGVGGAGVYGGHAPVWLLTNFILLLIAWDLDHFSRVLEFYGRGPAQEEEETAIIRFHLIRLGVIAALGWAGGVLTIGMRLSTPFLAAVGLSALVFFGLLQGILYFGQGREPRKGTNQ